MPRPRRTTEYYTVAKFEITRCYGGPEEGGWWYDAGEVVDIYPWDYNLDEEDWAQFIRDYLNAEEDNALRTEFNDRYRSRYSAAPSLGYDVQWFVCKGEPQNFPKERPHYE